MNHEHFIHRCFELARLGAGNVSPNPMVGAVLVHEGKIIGEGWHQKYGGPHAEVNAVASVPDARRHLISKSTLYVSLEPCCIFGRTPPCTNLILENKILKVVISAIDLTPEVKGQGVSILKEAGVEVITGILEKEGEDLAAIRNTFVAQSRPYIILKFAQSQDGFLGKTGEQVWISNAYAKRLVHRLRSGSDAILVGTNTALVDDPQLTNRLWFGNSPIRVLLDKNLRVGASQKIFDSDAKTIVVTENPSPPISSEHIDYLQIKFDEKLLPKLMTHLFEQQISTLIVEGGAHTLEEFLGANLWDEAWVFTGNVHLIKGIPAPKIPSNPISTQRLDNNFLSIFRNSRSFR